MRSGLVVLTPGESVGVHSTADFEEVLVLFEGIGEMVTAGGPTLKLQAGMVAYCPPETEHDVINVGSGSLRYLYLVARAESLSE